VTDTARVLLTAAVLSLAAMFLMAVRVSRLEPDQPERLIGELRVAQWAAVLLAGLGGIPLGLAVAGAATPLGNFDAALGVIFVGVAGIILQREPREALLLASAAFVVHALFEIAHRPGWLAPELAPPWYAVISAVYDVTIAALCYWSRRGN
jgi:hypothetical protein